MPSERVQRQIDRLLDEAKEAISSQDWAVVAERASAALRLYPENSDALSYLAAAERDPVATTAPQPAIDTSRARLEQCIPKELLEKLEGARRSGSGSGERRVVTMLFCDVTGSTSAAESQEPEEWVEIMNGAFEHLISPIYRYEGTVARLMGDAILAFFGAPIAHEYDPQRAVLVGLEIVNEIQDYQAGVKSKWGLDFGVRVGINTGLADKALEHADVATTMADESYTDFFRVPMALAYVHTGRLDEAEQALQPMDDQPRFRSKRNVEYMGILSSLPDVVRGELVLAQEGYEQILEYEIQAQSQSGMCVILPNLLRAKGEALFALGRLGEAWETLSEAREIGERFGSRRALWRIYSVMSRIAEMDGRPDGSRQLPDGSRGLIYYIAATVGDPEVRASYLNTPNVRAVIATQ